MGSPFPSTEARLNLAGKTSLIHFEKDILEYLQGKPKGTRSLLINTLLRAHMEDTDTKAVETQRIIRELQRRVDRLESAVLERQPMGGQP